MKKKKENKAFLNLFKKDKNNNSERIVIFGGKKYLLQYSIYSISLLSEIGFDPQNLDYYAPHLACAALFFVGINQKDVELGMSFAEFLEIASLKEFEDQQNNLKYALTADGLMD